MMKKTKARRVTTKTRGFQKTTRSHQTREEWNLAKLVDEINQRAFLIWEREGKPEGRDFDIWLKAEKAAFKKYFKR
jgi:hypothetical protein